MPIQTTPDPCFWFLYRKLLNASPTSLTTPVFVPAVMSQASRFVEGARKTDWSIRSYSLSRPKRRDHVEKSFSIVQTYRSSSLHRSQRWSDRALTIAILPSWIERRFQLRCCDSNGCVERHENRNRKEDYRISLSHIVEWEMSFLWIRTRDGSKKKQSGDVLPFASPIIDPMIFDRLKLYKRMWDVESIVTRYSVRSLTSGIVFTRLDASCAIHCCCLSGLSRTQTINFWASSALLKATWKQNEQERKLFFQTEK